MPKQVKKYGKIALVLGLILVLMAMYLTIPVARAGDLDKEKDTLSDSRPSTVANHTILFVVETAIIQDQTIVVKPDDSGNAFNLTGIIEDDIDLAEDDDNGCDGSWTEEETVAGAATATEWGITINTTTDEITLTAPTGAATYIAANRCVQIEIGDNATYDGTGSNQITNPASAASYDITMTTSSDSGKAMVYIITGVTVSATVSESLSFAISGVTNANCDSDTAVLAGPDTDATLVAFGTLASTDTFYHACQDLTIGTNAADGYSVTAQEQTNLMYSTYTFDDTTGDNGTMTESVSDTWATATYNGFGFSCVNKTGTDCSFTYANYRQFACRGTDAQCDVSSGDETAQTIMTSATPIDGNISRIEYKLSAGAAQEAGGYTATIVYIATPTY